MLTGDVRVGMRQVFDSHSQSRRPQQAGCGCPGGRTILLQLAHATAALPSAQTSCRLFTLAPPTFVIPDATVQVQARAVTTREVRKAAWFERFAWFVSSENCLVLSARDAAQADLLVMRHMRCEAPPLCRGPGLTGNEVVSRQEHCEEVSPIAWAPSGLAETA